MRDRHQDQAEGDVMAVEHVAIADTPIEDYASTTIDWDTLQHCNPDVAAWVRVNGTDIDLPVVQPADGDMSFYLDHDLWRKPSVEGVPFLDHRSDPDGLHRMAFGHHLTLGGQFSSLQMAYQEEVFDTLGSCSWDTKACGTTILVPLCALRADMWYEDIQRFSFDGAQDLSDWLSHIAEASSAKSAAWRDLALSARSVVTLVTCSSNVAGKQWRTLVLFVEVPTPRA